MNPLGFFAAVQIRLLRPSRGPEQTLLAAPPRSIVNQAAHAVMAWHR
jgi:hypothetical protein